MMTPAGWGLTTSWRWRWHFAPLAMAERVPWAGSTGRHPANRRDPLMMRAGGTPHVCHAQPDQIYRDRNSLPADRPQTSPAGKPPFTAGSTGTYAEFVIAIADLGHCRCLTLVCPACFVGSSVA